LQVPGARRFVEQLLALKMESLVVVKHKGWTIKFVEGNHLCRYRAESFSTKEPDTLEWLEAIPENSVLWDIGANVGLYSIYLAKQCKCQVYAFEPSVFNLEVLARNVFLNGLQERITIVPVALSDELGVSMFKMTSTNWGGALSTFGKEFDQNGKEMSAVFQYRTIGMTMSNAVSYLGIPLPNFIKLDVDGIEHLVLKGGLEVLRGVSSVLVEINDDFVEQSEQSQQILTSAGLRLKSMRHMVGGQHNQWWVR
jgi:FkbM family methyltransferase